MTEKLQCEMNEIKKNTMANSTYPKVAVQWLNQAQCFYQRFCLVDSEVLRNRHLRVAANRWRSGNKTTRETNRVIFKILYFSICLNKQVDYHCVYGKQFLHKTTSGH